MNILYVARLFSGLERSVAERRWVPTGVPTIYKMIEELSRHAKLHLLLLAKDGHTSLPNLQSGKFVLEGLDGRVYVMNSKPRTSGPARKIASALREVRHAAKIVRDVITIKPDLIYIDHGNIWTAGVLARCIRTPIVLRVMGVYPAMREALTSNRAPQRYLKWCYKAPFSAVICTQDGSGIEPWLDTAIRPGVPVHKLINGVDDLNEDIEQDPRILAIPETAIVVMFLGKLEHEKGALQFARGFAAAARSNPQLHALIIGAGSIKDEMLAILKRANSNGNVTLIERLPHDQVLSALKRADIYVSLNRFGNLSNANLEAMRVGVAMIFPGPQPSTGVDLETDRILPSNVVTRIASADDIDGLQSAIASLSKLPDQRSKMAEAVRKIATNQIGDWSTRTTIELDILRSIGQPNSDHDNSGSPTWRISET